jgi:hypothetical protein
MVSKDLTFRGRCGSRTKKNDLAEVSTAVALIFEEMNFRYVCELIRHWRDQEIPFDN